MKASYHQYILRFKNPSGTSRGVLTQKETWFLRLEHEEKTGIGECGILRGLSFDDQHDYQEKLHWTCQNIHLGEEVLLKELSQYPSIRFGIEQVFASVNSPTPYLLFNSDFTQGKKSIPINGLIWMGSPDFMKKQIAKKLQHGFHCIKMKIGALNFETEYEILKKLRKEFHLSDLEIRVDANGAFTFDQALEKLKRLSDLNLHSIEQPIKAGLRQEMAWLCQNSPLDIALDEELITIFSKEEKIQLLEEIRPKYIILKPSLLGGYKACQEWIHHAENQKIGWWITSALESNIGLNAIAQWTFTLQNNIPQGLGTGSLYTNNISSPLVVDKGNLHYLPDLQWENISF